jgi:hypothetical protein
LIWSATFEVNPLTNQVVGFPSLADYNRVVDAVNTVRRGALEHPFHRRQGPVGGDESAYFRIAHDVAVFAGCRDSDGIAYEIEGYRVTAMDPVTFEITGTASVTETINARHFDGLLVPGLTYLCERQFGKWVPSVHGQTYFSRCLALDDIGSGTIRIYLDESPVVSVEVEAVIVPGGEPVATGSDCTAFWDAARKLMIVNWGACPPV